MYNSVKVNSIKSEEKPMQTSSTINIDKYKKEIAEKGYAAHFKYKQGDQDEKGLEVFNLPKSL